MVIDENPDHGAMVHQQAHLGQGTPTELGPLANAVNLCIQRQLCSGRGEHNIVDEIGQRLIGQHGQRHVRQTQRIAAAFRQILEPTHLVLDVRNEGRIRHPLEAVAPTATQQVIRAGLQRIGSLSHEARREPSKRQ